MGIFGKSPSDAQREKDFVTAPCEAATRRTLVLTGLGTTLAPFSLAA